MRKIFFQTGALLAMFAFAAAVCVGQTDTQAAYAANCGRCHGRSGAGDTPLGMVLKVKPLNDPAVLSMTDTALTGVISNGSGKMQGFQNLFSSDQISDLVQYLHQLQTNLPSQ